MKYIKTIAFVMISGLLLTSTSAFAAEEGHDDQMVEQGKVLVESNVSCDDLTESQLEMIGDYYMEQMHPGESHEFMDDMMGGEGSETLRDHHIQMARAWYCGEGNSVGMMGTMMGSGGMMGGNMMGLSNNNYATCTDDESEVCNVTGQNDNVPSRYNMMGTGNMWYGGFHNFSVTTLLTWIFLLGGIAAFAKYLIKK